MFKLPLLILFIILTSTAFWFYHNPSFPAFFRPSFERASPINLREHISHIISKDTFRNYQNIDELNRVATYIKDNFEKIGLNPKYQEYQLEDTTNIYKNVIGFIDVGADKTFIIGAHYDVYGNQAGADDNASGVAGLVEVARLLFKHKSQLKYNIEFVAFSLEEPPYFRTEYMGSYIHAQSIKNKVSQYTGMMALEMIGFFSEEDIQSYPTVLKPFYPNHADYIASVGNIASFFLVSEYARAVNQLGQIEAHRLAAPASIEGVDFSDHYNYWDIGLKAIMVTDTAFMRNKNYHEASDTIETLNFIKMSYVINGIINMMLE
ncbi:MAG: M28 family peptidase [Alphaproteobacteria bacterium]